MRGPSPTVATTAGRPFTSETRWPMRLALEPAAQEPDGRAGSPPRWTCRSQSGSPRGRDRQHRSPPNSGRALNKRCQAPKYSHPCDRLATDAHGTLDEWRACPVFSIQARFTTSSPRQRSASDDLPHATATASVFLATLARRRRARRGGRCLAYCLMPDHYHLLVETPSPNLSEGMHYLNSDVRDAVQRAHEHAGHVFQKRFHSELVTGDEHLLEALRYIVLNPVRAGRSQATRRTGDWSSYRATAGQLPLATDGSQIGPRAGAVRAGRREPRGGIPRRSFMTGIGDRPTWRSALDQLIIDRSSRRRSSRPVAIHGYTQAEIAATSASASRPSRGSSARPRE